MNWYMMTRKKGHLFVLFFSAMLISVVGFLLSRERAQSVGVEKPVFSQKGGFYEEAFYLSINAPEGTEVYYTLDGSEPDIYSYHYKEPIYIDDATANENVYSMITETSVGFRTDLIEHYETRDADPQYEQPDYLVEKCTIVRAVAVGQYGQISNISTESYFVGIEPEYFDQCNIISIITDPENLFDPEKGIYVTGNVFEEYLEKGEMDENWRFWETNYTQRGKEWEREAVFQIFDQNGDWILSKEGGIRTRGGVSRGTLPRGLNLYAREEYDGSGLFEADLFHNGFMPENISLTSGGNQLTTQFSDYMMTQRTRELQFATMEFEPYVLFLNGEYWGFYWLAEKYDATYMENHYEVESDQVVIVKNWDLEVGKDKDILLFNNMMNYIQNTDMTIEKNYEKAKELIDIDSFLDYYATMIYIARSEDWPGNNFAVWRSREVGESEYADGRWRWLLFDCNSASMREDKGLVSHDTLAYVIENEPIFASLWENDTFREQFEERILYIADECFAAEDMNSFIWDYNERMIPILSKTWARFHGSENMKLEEYNARMESYRIFFENRKETVEKWFEN